jgi:hypothetical protein
LNGHDVEVRPNLHNALQQIKASALVDHYLWVDAICINQADDKVALDERSLQITFMREIYEKAANVIVWLGKPESEENNRLAFSLMNSFEKRFIDVQKKTHAYRPWWWSYWKQFRGVEYIPQTIGLDIAEFLRTMSPATDKKVFDVPGSLTHNAWLGMVSLWKQPWWNRTWVFQEATVPPSKGPIIIYGIWTLRRQQTQVRLICGDQETTWSKLVLANHVAINILSTSGIDSQFLRGAPDSAAKLGVLLGRRVQNVYRSFLDSLQIFRETTCFDPRDKVYAPLCLAPVDVRRFIQPDYDNKTVLHVYLDVVQYCFEQPGHELDFLGYALYRNGAQEVETPKSKKWLEGVRSILPSWVPNFSAQVHLSPIPKTLHLLDKPELPRPTLYYGSSSVRKSREARMRREKVAPAYQPLQGFPSRSFIDGNTLFVSGAYIDSIKDIMPQTGSNLDAIRNVGREMKRKWAIDPHYRYFTGESFSKALQHTFVLDLVYDEETRPSQRGGRLNEELLRRPRAELSLAEFRLQLNIQNALVRASVSRCMGLSQRMYLLMVPITAVLGDLVWALAGGQVLYILRPVYREANQYIVIGECYAHGLMDGEITRMLEAGETRMEDIALV